VIFGAEDIGDQNLLALVLVGEEANRDASDRRRDRDAGVHHCQRADADGGHGGGAVRPHDVRDHPDAVRIILRHDPRERTLGQGAVPDLAAAGAAEAADLADAVGREVVVQHEGLAGVAAGDGVEILRVLLGAERDGSQGRGLAALENRRAVRPGHDADLRVKFADLIRAAAVDALAVLKDVLADEVDLERVEKRDEGCNSDLFRPLLKGLGLQLVLDRLDRVLAFQLVADEQGLAQGGLAVGIEKRHLLGVRGLFCDHLVRLAEQSAQLVLGVNDFDDLRVASLHGGKKILFGDLSGSAFHHQKTLARAGIDQVEVALFALGLCGVDHEFAIDAAHAHATDRAHEGNLGDMEGGRGGVDRQNIRVVFAVRRKNHIVDLHVVPIAFRKERADRTISNARGEDFLLARARLTFEETAGETAGRVILLAVFDLQREKVDALARLVRTGDGGEHQGIAQAADCGTGSLTGEQSGLNGHRGSAHLDGNRGRIIHLCFTFQRTRTGKLMCQERWLTLRVMRCPREGLRARGEKRGHAAVSVPAWPVRRSLAAEAQLFDDLLVSGLILALEIVKQAAAGVYLADQPVTGAVVLFVGLQVLSQHLDLFGENGDLDFARTGVALVTLELLPNGCFIDLAHNLLCGPCSACFFAVNFPAHTIKNIPAACKAQIRPDSQITRSGESLLRRTAGKGRHIS